MVYMLISTNIMPLIFTNTYNHIDMDRKPSNVVRNQCQHVINIYMHCFLSVLITISQQNEIVIAISQQNEIAEILNNMKLFDLNESYVTNNAARDLKIVLFVTSNSIQL